MLDQFITNSIKYKQTEPNLTFYIREDHDGLELIVEDNGIGIAPEDAPYIFDRGFIGHNLRDGDYRSTGMGLYFVKEIAMIILFAQEAALNYNLKIMQNISC